MAAATAPTPAGILGALLAGHPEAASLLGEASHHQALAERSASRTGRKFAAMQAVRASYEELGHRLDPRHQRPVNAMIALALLAGLATGLAVIDDVELTGVLTGPMLAPTAIAVMAAWLTGAWLTADAVREHHRGVLAAVVTAIGTTSLLLAALHVAAAVPRSSPTWMVIGASVLGAALIDVLTAGAAMLTARAEPFPVFVRRQAWRRARTGYETAVRLERADAEAAKVAAEAWLGLVRRQAAAAGHEESVLQDVMVLASALPQAARPSLP
jgi:hypothetical protein